MTGNLDDFLKRAAQRRAQNEAVKREQVQRQTPPTPRRSEYTDLRRERQVVVPDDDEDYVVAEVIRPSQSESVPYRQFQSTSQVAPPSQPGGYPSAATNAFDPGVRDAAVVSVTGMDVSNTSSSPRVTDSQGAAIVQRPAEHPLVTLFRDQQSVKQAIVMREILDRPVDRW